MESQGYITTQLYAVLLCVNLLVRIKSKHPRPQRRMMIGVNDLLFPLFLGCIVSPVLIYLFCFFVFHLFLISDGFCYFENNKTKKKKKKIHPTTFFLLLHPYNSLGKRWWGMASFIYRKISSRNAQADTKFFLFFFKKSLFYKKEKLSVIQERHTNRMGGVEAAAAA